MKSFLLFTISLFSSLPHIAQNVWFSPIQKNESAAYPLLSITEDAAQKNYYVLTFSESNDSYSITNTQYDSTLQQTGTTEHSWKKGTNDKISFLGSAILQKKYYAFFSIITESTLLNELVLVEFHSGHVHAKTLDSYTVKSITNTGAYKMSFSKNNTAILVMIESMIEKGKNESVRLLGYDDVFNKKTDLTLSFVALCKPNPVNKCFISDKGDIYIIKKDREKAEYKFYLYAYNNEVKGWNQRQFTISAKLIADIDACMNSSDEFIVAGFYNSYDVTNYEGYFYYRFDNSLKPATKINQRFTPEFMTNFIGKKAASKDDAVISGYVFEHLVPGPNDRCYIVAEKEEYTLDGTNKKHFYGDILYIELEKEGAPRNLGALKNKQESLNDEGEWSSFNFAASEDTLHIFHNELSAAENKTKFSDLTFAGTYHSKIYKGSTNDTQPASEMILDKEAKLAFHPHYVYHTSDDHLIFLLLSKDKMNYALGKVELK